MSEPEPQPQQTRKRTKVRKHPIEHYHHYTIYIVSGISPTLFIAEKDDPSKGATVSADSLDELKAKVDDVLNFAATIHINTWQGPDNSEVLQNIKTRVKSTAGEFQDGMAVIIHAKYDWSIMIEMYEEQPFRRSKKHSKKRATRIPVVKIVCRNRTIQY